MKKSNCIIGIFLLWLAACNYANNSGDDKSKRNSKVPIPETEKIPDFKTTRQVYRLWHSIDQFDLSGFTYYGEFYNRRLRFFYATHPEISIGPAQVDLIMLYFLDKRLVKIRYHLNQDLTNYILDSLGTGLLKTRYSRHRRIPATLRTLQQLKNFSEMNGHPEDYEIYWNRHIIESRYEVNQNSSSLFAFDTVSSKYVYIDQLASYRKNLIEIENQLKKDTMLLQ